MTAAPATMVAAAAHISAITQLVLAERECRDMGRWERMKSCYHPDSTVHISWFTGSGPDFVDASREMARRGVPAKHRLGPVSVRVNGNRAVATMVIAIDIPAVLDGIEVMLTNHARVFYRAEFRGEGWRLSSFEVIYMRDELHARVPGQTFTVNAQELTGYRASYRCLSLVLSRQGFPIGNDLAGEDKPETVEALCQEIYGWAGLEL